MSYRDVLSAPRNRFLINGHLGTHEVKPLSIPPQSVGWETVPEEYRDKSADDLLKSAVGRLVKEFDFGVQFRRRFPKIGGNFRQLLPLLSPFCHGMAHHGHRSRRDRRLTDEPNLAICS